MLSIGQSVVEVKSLSFHKERNAWELIFEPQTTEWENVFVDLEDLRDGTFRGFIPYNEINPETIRMVQEQISWKEYNAVIAKKRERGED